MSDPLAGVFELLATELAHLRPGGAEVIDVHTHLGDDEDAQSHPAPLVVGIGRSGQARSGGLRGR